MIGFIGKITAFPGMRAALLPLMVREVHALDGCEAYIVSADVLDPDVIWVTEVWRDVQSQAASLTDATVWKLIAQARPMIAGFETVATTSQVILAAR